MLVATNTRKSNGGNGNHPFRFLASWLQHPQFKEVVKRAWDTEGDVLHKVDGFATAVQDWNRVVLGNIFTRKKEKKHELEKVQRALDRRFSEHLHKRS